MRSRIGPARRVGHRSRLVPASLALVCLAGAAAVLAPVAAAACSVCLAGDPLYDASGATVQEAGSFTAYLELRGWGKKAGVNGLDHGDDDGGGGGHENPHDHFDRSVARELRALASWTPIDRLSVTAMLPVRFTRLREREGDESSHFQLTGLGDVQLGASGVVWRDRDALPSTWVELRAFLKAPTGPSRQRVDGEVDKHLQPGTGSWDFGFGVAAARRLAWGTLYGSLIYRVNTDGSLDYRYGDVALANAALEVPLGHVTGVAWLERFTPGLELNYRFAEKDQQGNDAYEDSGGSILYLTPSLRLSLAGLPWLEGVRAPSLRASVQVPLTDRWLYGYQKEGEVWAIGLLVPF